MISPAILFASTHPFYLIILFLPPLVAPRKLGDQFSHCMDELRTVSTIVLVQNRIQNIYPRGIQQIPVVKIRLRISRRIVPQIPLGITPLAELIPRLPPHSQFILIMPIKPRRIKLSHGKEPTAISSA
ncbi:hypothetical protein QBC40DRAFT_287652 [Triangularia verruculosa]|uniref:Uncharacterized protein n=1 Tax=Triangularia verruculosa TaxID=2587418 RepID=A0AAN6XAW0_9PEZI|nr:hypothetical protein QBC40DRAFT_287652 [Triangularia verruculosa]